MTSANKSFMGFLDRPQMVWWRKALFQVHLWAGVIVAAYMIAISLSGSILVYQRDLQDDTPRLAQNDSADDAKFDPIVAIAQKAYPGEPLDNIDLRTLDRRVVPVGLKDGERDRIVYVDSVSRKIVGEEILQARHPVLQFLEDLHNELAGGRSGALINGVGGFLLTLMSITGIVLWWPGRKNWKRALNIKWSARWARVNWDLHSAFGFWTLLLVGMWGITGAYFIFPQPFARGIAFFSSMAHMQEKPSQWRTSEGIHDPDAYIGKAQQLYPDAQLAYFYMNTARDGGVVKVFLSRDPERPLVMMEDVVSFDPATLEILSDISTRKLTAGEKLSLAVYSIHFGDFGGQSIKFLWFVIGLSPALLAITGLIMWWNRVLKKKWRNLKSPATQPISAPKLIPEEPTGSIAK
ncbi:MAG: PepSY-associated TM helix domain-containing protein [Terriglobia bacterium]|nr:PepSY-associated TM helix domain-containing protein [Terriglobia bacterium]